MFLAVSTAAGREMCHMYSFLVAASSSFFKIRVEAVIVMVIHSWVAMVKSVSPSLYHC